MRAISERSRVGSPRSQPSEISRTTGPWPRTRRAHSTLNVRSASPMRVPPPKSPIVRGSVGTTAPAAREASCRVMRVRRVANTNDSTRAVRSLPPRVCTKWSSMRL